MRDRQRYVDPIFFRLVSAIFVLVLLGFVTSCAVVLSRHFFCGGAGFLNTFGSPERRASRQELDNFETAMLKALDELGGDLDRLHRRKDELEREVGNLTHAVAQGDFSPALRVALADREREIGEITAKVLESRPDSLRVKLRNLRSFVVLHMRDIRSIINSDAAKTRSLFAKHIEKITLTPTREHYVASGTWNFVGRGSIGGAGGPACTTRLIEFQVSLAA